MITVYFDACTNDDYDKIVNYLLKKQCPMAKRNKIDMSLAAKVPEDLPKKMLEEVRFEEPVNYGNTPLDEENGVGVEDVWTIPESSFAE